MAVKPISVEEIEVAIKKRDLPDEVIIAVNKLLNSKALISGKTEIKIFQEEVIEQLIGSYTRDEIFEKHLLDFEEIYKEAGWEVLYDKPAYNETCKAFFIFKKKSN